MFLTGLCSLKVLLRLLNFLSVEMPQNCTLHQMKKRFKLLLVLLCPALLMAQETDSAWVRANYQKTETRIAMRDGVKLFTTIYSPKDQTGTHPVLMMRTPYSVAPYGAGVFSPRLYLTHWKKYLARNYIIVMQDVRGKYMSEGEFVDVRPHNRAKKDKETDESSDTYDTIDWLIKNVKNNNGNVGVFGISYPGFYSTMAALCDHPALKAVSPQAPVTDWFIGDDFHHNGAFALHDAFRFYSGFGKPRTAPGTSGASSFVFPQSDIYNFHLQTGGIKEHSALLKDSIPFWSQLLQHPDYDDWWKARDARRACTNVKPAVLVVGGLFDAEDLFGAWNLYKAIEKQSPATENKIVMGPWYHGGWHRAEGTHLGPVRFGAATSDFFQDEVEVPFFEKHLRNKDVNKEPAEATVFFTGQNSWQTFTHWPPAGTKTVALYFSPNETAGFEKPSKNAGVSRYVSDPHNPVPFAGDIPLKRNREYMIEDQRFAARRPDVLEFSTEIFSSDLTLAGPVEAQLQVSISCTDADFVVKIIDVFPDDFNYQNDVCCKGADSNRILDGYQMLVRGEIMRGKYRNSFEKPESFIPGQKTTVKFTLPDVAHTFKKGHRLMVQIQSSWYPLFDMNPQRFTNIYQSEKKDAVPCTITLHHNVSKPSMLILPILEK